MTSFPAAFEPEIVSATYWIYGLDLIICDTVGSQSAPWITDELNHDSYGISRIPFAPDDTVVDVGAHVGLFSLSLALLHPEIRVIAYEPDPVNFRNLEENVSRRAPKNLTIVNAAVTADGRPFELATPPTNTGGAGGFYAYTEGYRRSCTRSVTLDQLFAEHGVERCRLLKMDCEGAEHEILPTTKILDRVEWFSGEFHVNAALENRGCSNEGLLDYLQRHVDPRKITIMSIQMGE